MARLRRKGATSTRLLRDDDAVPLPIMPWGTVHSFTVDELASAINPTPVAPDCGVISIIAIGGDAHFVQGGAGAVATTADAFLPEGEWHELPVFEGSAFDHVALIAASGAGSITIQICERQ